jgi:lysophospholipase L1-like esterase
MKPNLYRVVPAIFIALLAGALSGCASMRSAQQTTTPVALSVPKPVLGTHSAVTPASRISPDKPNNWWEKRHNQFNETAAEGNHDLILIGDSITHGWESGGKDVWEKYYTPRNAMNLGISGDRTQHVIWRLQNGNFDGQTPKLCVIMIGTNNYNDNNAQEIADGITAIVYEILERSPKTKVLILGIFPRFEKPHPKRAMLAEASALSSKLADGKRVFYLDIGDAFLDDDGTLPAEIMPDFLHPNAYGYKLWAEAMEPTIAELLGE